MNKFKMLILKLKKYLMELLAMKLKLMKDL